MLIIMALAFQFEAAVPVDRRGRIIPMDTPLAVAARIATICPLPSTTREALLDAEATLAQGISTRATPNSDWLQVACIRSSLMIDGAVARPGVLMPRGSSWGHGAVQLLLALLRNDPSDDRAARLLSALMLQIGKADLPAVAPPYEPRAEKEALSEPAQTVFASVRAASHSPDVHRACTSLLLDTGDFLTARDCSLRALARGYDSTWHLLRLAYVASHQEDTVAAAVYFRLAGLVARDRSARSEFGWHLDIHRTDARAVLPTRFVLDSIRPGQIAIWMALDDNASRARWLSARWDSVVAKAKKPFGAVVVNHMRHITYARGSFHECVAPTRAGLAFHGDDPSHPCYPQLTSELHTIGAYARLYRLWDAAGGVLSGYVPYAIQANDLEPTNADTASFAVEFSRWPAALPGDTVLQLHHVLPRKTEGKMVFTGELSLPGMQSESGWRFLVVQGSTRRGGTSGDRMPAIPVAGFAMSDVVVGGKAGDSFVIIGADTVRWPVTSVAPATATVDFFVQLRSDTAGRANVKIEIRRIRHGDVEAKPALAVSFSSQVSIGVSPFHRTLDLTRLGVGSYTIDVTAEVGTTRRASRATPLTIE